MFYPKNIIIIDITDQGQADKLRMENEIAKKTSLNKKEWFIITVDEEEKNMKSEIVITRKDVKLTMDTLSLIHI